MTGSKPLSTMPGDIALDCVHCDRKVVYRKVDLMVEFGGDIVLPSLRHKLARQLGCKRVDNTGHLERCGIRYEDLK